MAQVRNVCEVSNELEFNLHDIDASRLIQHNTISLVHEVNPRDIVELNVSRARDIAELNKKVENDVSCLVKLAESLGGRIYGGSSLLCDVSSVEPKRLRTTSLSNSCARGFMDITSQQIVLGITDEAFGFELYNFFRNINPVLLALSASSPYVFSNGNLEDTLRLSRRMLQYEILCRHFPPMMWRNMPELHSMDEYFRVLNAISEKVNEMLYSGELDPNWEELKKVRDNGAAYIPFKSLEPHQIFWPNRIRPDHRNIENGGSSVFSLELRVADIPTTIERIQMLNSFVLGLAYYIADHSSKGLPQPFTGDYDDLHLVTRAGLDALICKAAVRDVACKLQRYSAAGLEERGFHSETPRFNVFGDVLAYGSDAILIRKNNFTGCDELRNYLIERLKGGGK